MQKKQMVECIHIAGGGIGTMKKAMCLLLSMLLMLSASVAGASTMSDRYDEALELFMQKQ